MEEKDGRVEDWGKEHKNGNGQEERWGGGGGRSGG